MDRSDPAGALYEPLSRQEERVLCLLAEGYTYAEMAIELVLSINTIKTHVKGVYRKLNVNKRSQALARARRLGLR